MSCDYLVSMNFSLKKYMYIANNRNFSKPNVLCHIKTKKCVNLNLIKDSVCIDNMIAFLNFKHVFYFQK